MKKHLILVVCILCLAGCAQRPSAIAPGQSPSEGLTHISETGKLKIGMHESEVIRILGPPSSRESGFHNGSRLWFKLYNPKYDTIPTNFLISTDSNGYVTFISDGG